MKYEKQISEDGRIICLLCRHYCQLKEGQLGVCAVNKNEKGKLKNLVYGHPSALNIDPVEKKPLYHFLPGAKLLSLGTVGCNFKCPFCQNWEISQEKEIDVSRTISPYEMVALAEKHRAEGIAYTYNEPTVFYPYAKDIGILAKEKGLKNIMVSNGFESPEVIDDMAEWVDAANIDLKSWDENYYKRVLKGGLDAVKDTLKRMVNAGLWLEVTTLIIPGENDGKDDLEAMAEFMVSELGSGVPWHLSAFFPHYKMHDHEATRLETLQRAKEIGMQAGLKYIYLGNVMSDNHTYCPQCKSLLVKREGYHVVENRIDEHFCPICRCYIEGVWYK